MLRRRAAACLAPPNLPVGRGRYGRCALWRRGKNGWPAVVRTPPPNPSAADRRPRRSATSENWAWRWMLLVAWSAAVVGRCSAQSGTGDRPGQVRLTLASTSSVGTLCQRWNGCGATGGNRCLGRGAEGADVERVWGRGGGVKQAIKQVWGAGCVYVCGGGASAHAISALLTGPQKRAVTVPCLSGAVALPSPPHPPLPYLPRPPAPPLTPTLATPAHAPRLGAPPPPCPPPCWPCRSVLKRLCALGLQR